MDAREHLVEIADQEREEEAAERAVEFARGNGVHRRHVDFQWTHVVDAATPALRAHEIEVGRGLVERDDLSRGTDTSDKIERREARAAPQVHDVMPCPEAGRFP